MQRWRRCGGAAAETGAHACGRAGRCQGKECGTRATAGRAGDTLTQDGHASSPTGRVRGAAGAWPDPSAVAPTRPCDRGQVSDPPGAVRRRTRQRLPGGHGPGQEGWICGKFQMPEDLPDHLALRDGGDDPQRPLLTRGAAHHVHRKDALEQPYPAPARRRRAVLLFLHAPLALASVCGDRDGGSGA